MASSSSRRRRRDDDDLEEGEFVPGTYSTAAPSYDTDDDDDDSFLLQYRLPQEEDEIRLPSLEQILAMSRATLPSHEYYCDDSDGTISDHDHGGRNPASFSAGGVTLPMRPVYACRVCDKWFGSRKAVDGHMRVHHPHGRHHGNAAVTAGGSKGKGKAVVSSSDEEPNHSMATVVSETNRPLPLLAFASRSNLSPPSLSTAASARTHLMESGGSSSSSPRSIQIDPVAASSGAYRPSNETFIHQHQQAQVVLQQPPAVAPPVPLGPADAPRPEYTCKHCGKSYPTNQALGGHVAGHKHRQREVQAAAAAAGVGQDGSVILGGAPQQTKEHRCKKCGKVFDAGVRLGGHMRQHYDGPPIVFNRQNKKQCVAPPPQQALHAVCMADLTRTLGTEDGQPSHPQPAPGRRLRLFGVDIWLPAEAPALQQGTDIGEPAAPEVQQGTDIRAPTTALPEVQQGTDIRAPAAPEVQQGSTDTTPHEQAPQEGSSSAMTEGGQRQDDEIVEKTSTDSPSMGSSN